MGYSVKKKILDKKHRFDTQATNETGDIVPESDTTSSMNPPSVPSKKRKAHAQETLSHRSKRSRTNLMPQRSAGQRPPASYNAPDPSISAISSVTPPQNGSAYGDPSLNVPQQELSIRSFAMSRSDNAAAAYEDQLQYMGGQSLQQFPTPYQADEADALHPVAPNWPLVIQQAGPLRARVTSSKRKRHGGGGR